jgi:hypothetical protein
LHAVDALGDDPTPAGAQTFAPSAPTAAAAEALANAEATLSGVAKLLVDVQGAQAASYAVPFTWRTSDGVVTNPTTR